MTSRLSQTTAETAWGIKLINDQTFEARPLDGKLAYGDLIYPNEPSGIMYLVRVFGRTGDSNGSENTHWDVDIFASEDEAEALAVAIDENYDVVSILDAMDVSTNPHRAVSLEIPAASLRNVPASRHEVIRQKLADWAEKKFDVKYFDALKTLTYRQCGQETITTTFPWQGYFDRMNYVDVIPMRRITENSLEVLRRRRW